jgi:hypothetical protein
LRELLTSELIRFWTEVSTDPRAEPFRRVFYYSPATCFADLLEQVGVPASADWTVSVSPRPSMLGSTASTQDLVSGTLLDIGLEFGSVLTIRRKDRAECRKTAA